MAQTVLDPEAVSPADALVKPPERVLKPWGIPMLPSDRPKEEARTKDPAEPTDDKADTASASESASSPLEGQDGPDATAMHLPDATSSLS